MSPNYPQTRLVEGFDVLSQRLSAFADLLAGSSLPLWIPLTDDETARGVTPRQRAIELYCDLWHRHAGDGRRTDSRHGLIGADDALLAAAAAVNEAKAEFESAVAAVRHEKTPGWQEALAERNSRLRDDLNRKGLGRLHLRQCYRRIPCLDRHPARVGFNWYSSGRSIRRIEAQEAYRALLKLDTSQPHIQIQLQQVGRLPPATALAKVQQQAPLMRANLSCESGETVARGALNLSLPLLFRWDPARPFPQHNAPPLLPPEGRRRRVRSDCRIEPAPFLPSLRVHRYAGGRP